MRVTALKTPLRETCSETGKVKGTVSEGDELEVVSRDGGVVSRPPARQRRRRRLRGGARRRTGRRLAPAWSHRPRRPPRSAARSPPRTATPPRKPLGASGFVDLGQTSFSAKDSFEAILDTSSGPIFGGGGQVNLPLNLFARVDVTRFKKDGERAFVTHQRRGLQTRHPDDDRGDADRVHRRLSPRIHVRPPRPARGAKPGARPSDGFRIIPFAGGGAGVVQYKETADFAQPGDDVDESFTSYHFIGGVEVPLWKFLGVGAEYHHRWVPDALGTGGVSEQFNETDLGGGTFRFRVIFGF